MLRCDNMPLVYQFSAVLPGAEHPSVDYAELSEIELELLVRQQNPGAFNAFTARYRPQWIRTAHNILKAQADAEDAVQEALLQVWKYLPQFRGEAGLRTWISRIVRNECLQHLRSRRRSRTYLFDDYLPPARSSFREFRDCGRDPEAACLAAETISRIRREIECTPPFFRCVLTLCHLDELAISAAARQLGVTEAALKSRLRRARATLANRLTAVLPAA
jgi:RNA polymerase sigma-70 factor (ECF subfamily)